MGISTCILKTKKADLSYMMPDPKNKGTLFSSTLKVLETKVFLLS